MAAPVAAAVSVHGCCTACTLVYNDTERQPKFLSCAHTLCLQCLELVASVYKSSRSHRFMIVCPKCGEETQCCSKDNNSSNGEVGVRGLPLNVFALKMSHEKAKVDRERWCLTCNYLVKASCSAGHTKLRLGDSTVSQARSIVRLYDECKTKRAQVVDARRQFQDYLDSLVDLSASSASNQQKEKLLLTKGVEVVGQQNKDRMKELISVAALVDEKLRPDAFNDETVSEMWREMNFILRELEEELTSVNELLVPCPHPTSSTTPDEDDALTLVATTDDDFSAASIKVMHSPSPSTYSSYSSVSWSSSSSSSSSSLFKQGMNLKQNWKLLRLMLPHGCGDHLSYPMFESLVISNQQQQESATASPSSNDAFLLSYALHTLFKLQQQQSPLRPNLLNNCCCCGDSGVSQCAVPAHRKEETVQPQKQNKQPITATEKVEKVKKQKQPSYYSVGKSQQQQALPLCYGGGSKSCFTLTLCFEQFGHYIGKITLQLDTNFAEPQLMTQLTQFCLNQPKQFSTLIVKARQKKFIIFEFEHAQFQPKLSLNRGQLMTTSIQFCGKEGDVLFGPDYAWPYLSHKCNNQSSTKNYRDASLRFQLVFLLMDSNLTNQDHHRHYSYNNGWRQGGATSKINKSRIGRVDEKSIAQCLNPLSQKKRCERSNICTTWSTISVSSSNPF